MEIFESEVETHLSTLDAFITACESSDEPQKITDEVIRACHTLRGCARTAGMEPMAQIGEALENFSNAVKSNELLVDESRLALIKEGVDLDRNLLNAMLYEDKPAPDPAPYLSLLHTETEGIESEATVKADVSGTQPEPLDETGLNASQDEESFEASLEELTSVIELDEDKALLEIFLEEAQELIGRLNLCAGQWRNSREEWTQLIGLQRTLHTLKGSARLVGATPMGDLGQAMESLLTVHYQNQIVADEPAVALVQSGIDRLLNQADEIEQSNKITLANDLISQFLTATENLVTTAHEPSVDEGSVAQTFEEPGESASGQVELQSEVDDLSQLDEAYEAVSLPEEELAAGVEAEVAGTGAAEVDDESENQPVDVESEVLDGLAILPARLVGDDSDQVGELGVEPDTAESEVATSGLLESEVFHEDESISVESEFFDSELLESGERCTLGDDDELIDVFLEEARELTESMEGTVQRWLDGEENTTVTDQLLRALHTLKGSARMAGAQPVADLSHALESLLTLVDSNKLEPAKRVKRLVQHSVDRLASQVDEIEKNRSVGAADELIDRLRLLECGDSDQIGGNKSKQTGQIEELAPAPIKTTPTPRYEEGEMISRFAALQEEDEKGKEAKTTASQSQVRISSDVLDQMVNQAGEVSIYRSRLEEQNSTLKYNLQELDRTVTRLHEQLRNLDIETEAQILFRHEREFDEAGKSHSDFDPLELDRFSTMQQLSRSLMETVSDLGSIGGLLDEQQRGTETLLLQQSRVSVNLQDRLLHTRMVPFSHLVPRLSRVVRQTATQTGREAELSVTGVQDEMDRSILNRMIPALEHILRNAVSHGIELPDERSKKGKPITGQISLSLRHEGTNMVLVLEDDGAGLDLQAIHDKALSHGLIDPVAEVSDDDLMQLILESGFSTAKEVTQIAGRGVGLDVVSSEVKQLGGLMELSSEPGRGTRFTIQLPLTLAITDALLIQMGEHIYAVPHGSIEGTVRIGRDELLGFYADQELRYNYAGHEYKVDYLGNLLATGAPLLLEGERWFPLLLVHVGEHRIALQVDGLLGTRQVVVKGVGSQLSSLRWITGGTILGDGRVALIMDMSALVRATSTHALAVQAPQVEEESAGVTALVVDDSITVRKVTSRLLERHNIQVMTAKDGVDAIAVLQDHHPDVVLLDIEMPRMDGFELARHMRNSPDWSDIPIIMISSRVGKKHRDHAFELGVKSCLGKPYQESELLENIYAVLGEEQT